MKMLPVLLLYTITVGMLYVGALTLHQNWIIYLLYRYRLVALGIGVFLFIFAAGEANSLRRR